MKSLTTWVGFMLAGLCVGSTMAADVKEEITDWPNLGAYQAANVQVGLPAKGEQRVVFMGDSITEFWTKSFWNQSTVNRGISGQTSPQMLLRFRADVIDLKPAVVVILAGTNDVAGNTGPASVDMIAGNIASMAELAQTHGIKVVLCAVLPAASFYWNLALKPADKIAALNQKIKAYAEKNKLVYVDYYTPMVDERMGLKKEYSGDGVHPNDVGYQVMIRLVAQGIAAATSARP